MLKRYPSLRCWVFIKSNLQEVTTFRTALVFQIISNFVYLTIITFLWKAIYNAAPSQSLSGMAYKDTILYLALAIGLYSSMQVYLVESISWEIRSGGVIFYLLKPINYQTYVIWTFLGRIITQFLFVFIPTVIFSYLVIGETFLFGKNLILFFVSFFMSMLISLSQDFLFSLICFYIESSWGLCIVKDTITMLFSGVMIPIALLPEMLQKVAVLLPFQAIYNIPIQFLTKTPTSMECFTMLGKQLIWVLILWFFGKYCFARISKVITVNGG